MNKKRFIILILLIFLVGGYYVGNYTFNKILMNKVENALKNDIIQKEINKLASSTNLEKEISSITTEELQKESKPEIPQENDSTKTEVDSQSEPKNNSEPVPASSQKPTVQTQAVQVVEEEIEQQNAAVNDQIEFATKNDAIDFVKQRFSSQEIAELYKIYSEAMKDGLTTEEKKALKEKAYEEAFEKFTPQEISAVKKIILGES